MAEREALLRAVCESPDDDTPRLVYADWLQENGDEARAEFIRVQIAAALGNPGQAHALNARADELLARHKERWLAELPDVCGWVWREPFVRGFVEELRVTSDMPTPPYDPDTAPAFAATPIVKFGLAENAFSPWVRHLRHVRWLNLNCCTLTRADALVLCSPDLGPRPTRFVIDTFAPQVEEGAVELLRAHFGGVLDARIETFD